MGRTNRDDRVYLEHIIQAVNKIEKYTIGLDYDVFSKDDLLMDGVIRELQVIGEAAGNLSDEFREEHSLLPLSQAIGMRNEIVHGYFDLDLRVIWDTSQKDLPHLKHQIEEIL